MLARRDDSIDREIRALMVNQLVPAVSGVPRQSLVTISVSATVLLEGELDCSTERQVTERVERLVGSVDVIRIDARNVTFIDAAGLRTLLLAEREALKNGIAVMLEVSPHGPVERLFAIAGLSDLIG